MTSVDTPIVDAFRASYASQLRVMAFRARSIATSIAPLSQDARCALESAADSIDNALFALTGSID